MSLASGATASGSSGEVSISSGESSSGSGGAVRIAVGAGASGSGGALLSAGVHRRQRMASVAQSRLSAVLAVRLAAMSPFLAVEGSTSTGGDLQLSSGGSATGASGSLALAPDSGASGESGLLSSPRADLSSSRVSFLCSLVLFRVRVAQARNPVDGRFCHWPGRCVQRGGWQQRWRQWRCLRRYRLVTRLSRAVVVVPCLSMAVLGASAAALS